MSQDWHVVKASWHIAKASWPDLMQQAFLSEMCTADLLNQRCNVDIQNGCQACKPVHASGKVCSHLQVLLRKQLARQDYTVRPGMVCSGA